MTVREQFEEALSNSRKLFARAEAVIPSGITRAKPEVVHAFRCGMLLHGWIPCRIQACCRRHTRRAMWTGSIKRCRS